MINRKGCDGEIPSTQLESHRKSLSFRWDVAAVGKRAISPATRDLLLTG